MCLEWSGHGWAQRWAGTCRLPVPLAGGLRRPWALALPHLRLLESQGLSSHLFRGTNSGRARSAHVLVPEPGAEAERVDEAGRPGPSHASTLGRWEWAFSAQTTGVQVRWGVL